MGRNFSLSHDTLPLTARTAVSSYGGKRWRMSYDVFLLDLRSRSVYAGMDFTAVTHICFLRRFPSQEALAFSFRVFTSPYSVEYVLFGVQGSLGQLGSFAYSLKKYLAPMFWAADKSQL